VGEPIRFVNRRSSLTDADDLTADLRRLTQMIYWSAEFVGFVAFLAVVCLVTKVHWDVEFFGLIEFVGFVAFVGFVRLMEFV